MTAAPDDVGALDWYHTIDLGGGVVTPGFFDHRDLVRRLPLPASLAGRRCLDVGSSDGFWAFEMCRRGADEVVSVDLEDAARQEWQGAPGEDRAGALTSGRWEGEEGRTRQAFELARAALGLDVERRDLSIYDLSSDAVGEFDFVFVGSLLLHLRDPVRGLAAVASVARGEVVSLEPILLGLSLALPRTPLATLWKLDEPRWWTPNMAGLRRMVEAAGLEVVRMTGPHFQRFGRGGPRRPSLRRPSLRELVFWGFTRPVGAPSACVVARPAG